MVTQQTPQQFCVRWNSYQSNLQSAFPKLLVSEHFVDVTLACENEMLKCHKVVLSACSTYFEKLLLNNPCQHPIIFMKDMRFQEMQSLVDFMYKGEVNVTQDDLPSLLKSAEALQIRGLCGTDQLLNHANLQNINKSLQVRMDTLNGTEKAPQTSTPKSVKSEHQQSHQTPQQSGPSEQEKTPQTSELPTDQRSSSDGDSNDLPAQKDHQYIKEEYYEPESADLMDTFLEEDSRMLHTADDMDKTPDFAIANVSCHYDGSPSTSIKEEFGGSASRRVRRSDEELRRAAECITRGQTFQTVSDQFNIPISTIRFYMARKGILPRRKRGRSCAGPSMGSPMSSIASASTFSTGGSTSPIGPPFHIVHYKLPPLGVSPKLK